MKVIKQSYEILDRRNLTNYEKIEQAGRVAYKSEDKIAEGSASIFIDKIINRKHFPVLEFANVHLKLTVKSDIFDDFFLTFLIGCKFINVTSFIDDNKIFHAFVSGTVRSLIEAIQSIYTSKPSPLMYRIIKVLGDNPDIPIGISDKLEEDYKNIDVSGCDVKMLTPREILGNKMLGQREEYHLMCAVKFITNRVVTHELVRHRPCSFLQESQRYCVSGNMRLSVRNPHQKLTVKDMYKKSIKDKFNRWKKSSIRQLDTETGEIIYENIENINFMGFKKTITIKTKLGYHITLTPDHEIYGEDGWIESGKLKVGDKIVVNGSETPYKNYEWIKLHYIDKQMTAVDIATMLNVNVSTIKKWIHKLGFHAKMKPNHQKNKPGNSLGVQYRSMGNAKSGYRNSYRSIETVECDVCESKKFLHRHHINGKKSDNSEDNIMVLCPSCHSGIHNKTLLYGIFDEIIEIKDSGIQEVFDIEMRGKFPNFFANGVCVHNCRYDQDKFGNEVTFINPQVFYAEDSEEYILWAKSMRFAERQYLKLLKTSSPQAARTVLPGSTKTEIIVYCTIWQWRHIFKLRVPETAEPSMREIMVPLEKEFFSEENKNKWE